MFSKEGEMMDRFNRDGYEDGFQDGFQEGVSEKCEDLDLVVGTIRSYVGNSSYMKELLIQALKDENLI